MGAFVNFDDGVVGIVGLGYMGRPMALRLVETCANTIVVFDESNDAAAQFSGRAHVVRSPEAVANAADIIIGCSPTVESYRRDVLGAEGLIHGSRMGIYVHSGTTGSALVKELQAALAERGVETIDAPITGGPSRARNGTLTVMAATSAATLKQAEPFLQCIANKIVHVGERPGAGQTMKVVNNIMSSTNLAIASEALVLGVKGGLDPEQIMEVVNAGTGQNSASLTWLPDQVLTRNFNLSAPLISMIKDLKAASDEAKSLGVPLQIGEVVRQVYLRAADEGSPNDDLTSLIRHMERASGVEVPKSR